ncbi:probable DNA-directed RNA polymerase subunit delta [Branchiostoma floridae]|uniref:Probable DNA-directed RNA polymerase subunit delta n=1 Tax=Branchiostoma floridae TaxID=7739 RepID=A0A9J7L2L6_BRAFL|nr:probable DNA-directed RNA polymerase subunit delta [Branchiostoma floridae]
MLKAAAGFKWDNAGCSETKYFICQTGPGDTAACGGQSAREVEADDADPAFEFSAVGEEEDPDVDEDQTDEIPREQLGETWEDQDADDVSEDEVDEDAILEELDGLLEELREIVEEKQMEMEEWVDEK